MMLPRTAPDESLPRDPQSQERHARMKMWIFVSRWLASVRRVTGLAGHWCAALGCALPCQATKLELRSLRQE
jgi:hypothetical protein